MLEGIVLNLQKISQSVNDNTELTVALENVLDEDYRVHGSGTNRPGINLIFGLRLSF